MATEQFAFDRPRLTALLPQAKRVYFRDAITRGLVLAVTPAGVKSFQLVRKWGGESVRVTLGRFDPDTPESREIPRGTPAAPFDPLAYIGNTPRLNVRMARTLATAVSAAMDRGENPAQKVREEREAARAELTLRDAFERYYHDHLIPGGRRKADLMRDYFARYLGRVEPGQKRPRGKEKSKATGAPDWERRKLSSIRPADVRRMMASIKDGGTLYGGNMAFVLLRAIYRKAIAWQLYSGPNPCDGIQKFPETERARFLRADEMPRFFEALARAPETIRHFVMLALSTGARRGNLVAMRWADIDLASALWTVPGEVSKNGAALIIPLTAPALAVLKERQGRDKTWVFPAASTSGHMINPRKAWDDLLKDAGLEDLRIHDLRRSLGSWAAIQGTSLAIIGAALGHKSPDATRVYARLTVDPVRDAMERATNAMLQAGGVLPQAEVIPLRKKA
ncbi:MAG TPA: site-specific integrase [Thiobacillaceae bacterium]|nr:site-specific integrase [Thiobacillaceae bacterium]